MTLEWKWIDRGFDPKNPPDPRFPNGQDIDLSDGAKVACYTSLPCPAQRCGYYLVTCAKCKTMDVVTTAGRPDDPRSFTRACKRERTVIEI